MRERLDYKVRVYKMKDRKRKRLARRIMILIAYTVLKKDINTKAKVGLSYHKDSFYEDDRMKILAVRLLKRKNPDLSVSIKKSDNSLVTIKINW